MAILQAITNQVAGFSKNQLAQHQRIKSHFSVYEVSTSPGKDGFPTHLTTFRSLPLFPYTVQFD